MSTLSLHDVDLSNKRVLIRVDFNVPIEDGRITSDARIQAALPTIQYALDQGAKVMLMSHLGRPQEGEFSAEFSLKGVAEYLSHLVTAPVRFAPHWLDGLEPKAGEIVVCENVRFNVGEKKNAPELAQKMAALCDVFVMDAFGTAHRAQASTYGVAEFAPVACAGFLLEKELKALGRAVLNPTPPVVAIVAGSKVSTKLTVLHHLLPKVDQLIVGGGIANTFLAATGIDVKSSLCEPDLIPEAKEIMAAMASKGGLVPLPVDVRVTQQFNKSSKAQVKPVEALAEGDMILDIGPRSGETLAELLMNAGTIIWNGPLGVFEFPEFSQGTRAVAEAIAQSPAFSLAGGGDTVAAIDMFGLHNQISYISTGGGAFLEFIEGKTLPAVEILQKRCEGVEPCVELKF